MADLRLAAGVWALLCLFAVPFAWRLYARDARLRDKVPARRRLSIFETDFSSTPTSSRETK